VKRRTLITLLGGAAAWPLAASAQQPAMPVIGFLNSGSPTEWAHLVAAFKDGLAEAGFVEGRNVAIEYRWGGDRYDRLAELAADLVRRQVAVIVTTGGANIASAAKAATSSIPIVFVIGTDPVESGFVTNLGRPDANLTGVTVLSTLLSAKRQELLHEVVPSAVAVAMLVNPSNASNRFELPDVEAAAAKIGQPVRVLNASTDNEIDAAFATIVRERIGGLLVQADVFFTSRRQRLVLLTTRHAIPTVFAFREFVTAGGLMSYGANLRAAYRLGSSYVGQILKGAKPGDLPVQQATNVELVINLRAAKVLGIAVPLPLLGRADEVIEDAARVHHAPRRRDGLAARGARAAEREDAAHWFSHEPGRRRPGVTGLDVGVSQRVAGVGLDRRPQRADRLSLERIRPHAKAQIRGRIGHACARRDRGHRRLEHRPTATGDAHGADRVRVGSRSGRRRLCREPGTAGWQRHRIYLDRLRYQRKMAGTAQADGAWRDARGGAS
jgi:putative tryptophan/tyrosine transport system substrate-binding protein